MSFWPTLPPLPDYSTSADPPSSTSPAPPSSISGADTDVEDLRDRVASMEAGYIALGVVGAIFFIGVVVGVFWKKLCACLFCSVLASCNCLGSVLRQTALLCCQCLCCPCRLFLRWLDTCKQTAVEEDIEMEWRPSGQDPSDCKCGVVPSSPAIQDIAPARHPTPSLPHVEGPVDTGAGLQDVPNLGIDVRAL